MQYRKDLDIIEILFIYMMAQTTAKVDILTDIDLEYSKLGKTNCWLNFDLNAFTTLKNYDE